MKSTVEVATKKVPAEFNPVQFIITANSEYDLSVLANIVALVTRERARIQADTDTTVKDMHIDRQTLRACSALAEQATAALAMHRDTATAAQKTTAILSAWGAD